MKKKYGSIAMDANNENNLNDKNEYKLNKTNKKKAKLIAAHQSKLNNKYAHLKKRKISLIKFNSLKWPKPYLHFSKKTGNVYMDLIKEDGGNNNNNSIKYFEFRFDNDYNNIQVEYKNICKRFNPDQISFLCQQHPYHVDTLLTMSDILKKHGKLEEAADFVERALYRLENSIHSRFSFISSDCRLDYNIIENRSFFVCLWKYSQNVGRRGCVHTAFELSKKLLSISPRLDPLCSLLVLDFWGLRSNKYKWLLSMAKSFKININNNNITQLDVLRMYPNWCYSCALAKYQIELQESYQLNNDNNKYTFGECDSNRIPMDLSIIDGLSSSILIQQAILMFPEIIAILLKKVKESLLKQSNWINIFQNSYFLQAKLRRNEINSLNKLCNIYAERCHLLWNNNDLINWLYKHCKFVIERLNNPLSFKIIDDNDIQFEKGQILYRKKRKCRIIDIDNSVNPASYIIQHDDDKSVVNTEKTYLSLNINDDDDELIEFEDLTVFNGIRNAIYDIDDNNNNKNNKNNKFSMLDVNEFSDVFTTLPVDEMPDALLQPFNNQQRIDLNYLQNLNDNELNNVIDQLLASGIDIPIEIQQRLNQGNNLQNQNVLSALLYSMMPWVNPIINQNNNQNDQNNPNNDQINDNKNDDDNNNNNNDDNN